MKRLDGADALARLNQLIATPKPKTVKKTTPLSEGNIDTYSRRAPAQCVQITRDFLHRLGHGGDHSSYFLSAFSGFQSVINHHVTSSALFQRRLWRWR